MIKKDKLNISCISTYRNELYGFSIIWILLFHGILCEIKYFYNFPPLSILGKFLSYGNMGCEVFFFLSGISLYFSFKKNSSLSLYFKRRVYRLFIPVILICGVYWGYFLIAGKFSLLSFLSRIFLLRFWFTGDQQIWFISAIFLFYFIYPYIYEFLFHNNKHSGKRTIFLIAITGILTYIISSEYPEIYSNIEIALTRLPVFIIGCFAGKFVYEKKELPLIPTLFLCLCSILFCFSILNMDILHGLSRRYFYLTGGIPLTILIAFLLSKLKGFLRPILKYMGNISLELYLSHIILIRLYKKDVFGTYAPENVTNYMIILLFSVLVSLIASLIQKYMRRLYGTTCARIASYIRK